MQEIRQELNSAQKGDEDLQNQRYLNSTYANEFAQKVKNFLLQNVTYIKIECWCECYWKKSHERSKRKEFDP